METDDWATPPDERKEKLKTDEMILETIRELKITYPAEIVGMTGLSRQTIFDRLHYLRTHGKIERVILQRSPPADLEARLPQLWDLGLRSAMIKRMTWYRLSEVKEDGS